MIFAKDEIKKGPLPRDKTTAIRAIGGDPSLVYHNNDVRIEVGILAESLMSRAMGASRSVGS
jgi:hypothetical protein